MIADDGISHSLRPDDVIGRLARLPLFAEVPRTELEWLVRRGEVRRHTRGDVLRVAGEPVPEMSIVLDGRVGMYVTRSGDVRRIATQEAGFVLGIVPYSRMRTNPVDVMVEEDATLVVLQRSDFPDLVSECSAITEALVHRMLDRAREFRMLEMHDERLVSLGRLASGLAHELNNPASGASSGARSLAASIDPTEDAARSLMAAGLTAAQLDAIDRLRAACAQAGPKRTAIEMADREDDFVDWLEQRDLDPLPGDALASSSVNLADLDALAETLPPDALGPAITWMAGMASARDAALQIQTATTRIRDLVAAVKGFTFMDRAGVTEPVDIAQGITDTLAVLETRARTKTIAFRFEAAPDLPAVHGYGSEINRVWEVLIANAIDAIPRDGVVTITATAQGEAVIVRVADDGVGIREDIRPRVFDPFFTTKPVGEGAGLGLHQARRIVHLHHGDIDFRSDAGHTVFRVRLPVTGATAVLGGDSPASAR